MLKNGVGARTQQHIGEGNNPGASNLRRVKASFEVVGVGKVIPDPGKKHGRGALDMSDIMLRFQLAKHL